MYLHLPCSIRHCLAFYVFYPDNITGYLHISGICNDGYLRRASALKRLLSVGTHHCNISLTAPTTDIIHRPTSIHCSKTGEEMCSNDKRPGEATSSSDETRRPAAKRPVEASGATVYVHNVDTNPPTPPDTSGWRNPNREFDAQLVCTTDVLDTNKDTKEVTNSTPAGPRPHPDMQNGGNIRMTQTLPVSKGGDAPMRQAVRPKDFNADPDANYACTQHNLSQCSQIVSSILDMQACIASCLVLPTGDTLRVYAAKHKPKPFNEYNGTTVNPQMAEKAGTSNPNGTRTPIEHLHKIMCTIEHLHTYTHSLFYLIVHRDTDVSLPQGKALENVLEQLWYNPCVPRPDREPSRNCTSANARALVSDNSSRRRADDFYQEHCPDFDDSNMSDDTSDKT